MPLNRTLEPLGISELAERLYEVIVDHPGSPLGELVSAGAVPARAAARALVELEANGLVSRTATRPATLVPAPPDTALEILLLRRQEELERVRIAARRLAMRFRTASALAPINLVEVISGAPAIVERFRQLQLTVLEELLIFDKPPYVSPAADSEAAELDALRRGVAVRTVYDRLIFEQPETTGAMSRMVAAGERARTMTDVPMKAVVADRRVGLVPLRLGAAVETAVVLHESPLLDALAVLFEALWLRATPVRSAAPIRGAAAHQATISEIDERILTLLASGMAEQAIARQVALHTRTVGRRIEHMMVALGVQTRFQLALRVAEVGWLRLQSEAPDTVERGRQAPSGVLSNTR